MKLAIYIWLALVLMSLGITLARHGEPKEGYYNFWVDLIATIVSIGLLWIGGAFNNL